MKLDLSKPVLDLAGNEIREGDTLLTYKTVFVTSLIGEFDEKKTADQKFNDFKLAMKLIDGEVDFTIEEISRIKKLVGNIHSTLIVGRTMDFIENTNNNE